MQTKEAGRELEKREWRVLNSSEGEREKREKESKAGSDGRGAKRRETEIEREREGKREWEILEIPIPTIRGSVPANLGRPFPTDMTPGMCHHPSVVVVRSTDISKFKHLFLFLFFFNNKEKGKK